MPHRMTEYQRMFIAFQRALLDLEKSFAPDPYKYCDYDYKLEETLKVLIYYLKEHEYRSKKAENFDLPKGEFAIRPGVIVDILDLTVINRLIVDFIFKLDEKLPPGVIAYRLRKDRKLQFKIERDSSYFVLPRYKREKIKIEESWYNLWPQYRKELLNDLKSGKYEYVAKTDITAYFEDINLLTLGEILKRKVSSKLANINVITEIYRSWALRDPGNIRQARGLPQGSNISGILSNYYLNIVDSYLDRESIRGKIKWYRYCDDFHILCKNRDRAVAILLKIGGLLRKLGLNQNAEKTKPMIAQEAISEIYNETSENISSIIDKSQKKRANKRDLIQALRGQFIKISRKTRFDKKLETSLFRTYTAALILDTPLLTKRVGKDFIKFPIRAKQTCNYARRFINYVPVFKDFSLYIRHRKTMLLYNFQLAFLATVFRNMKKKDREIFNAILEIALAPKRHWYVRVQAINTLSYLGVGTLKKYKVKQLMNTNNPRNIRRATITLIPLCCTPTETKEWLEEIAKDLNITTSRMANFLLDLILSKDSALNQLKKFKQMNYIFLEDQLWRLWFIALNDNSDVQKVLNSLLGRINKEFVNNLIIKEHIDKIMKFREASEAKITN